LIKLSAQLDMALKYQTTDYGIRACKSYCDVDAYDVCLKWCRCASDRIMAFGVSR